MKVFIITEGGKDIGFGHITRCLSLYQAFEERGIKPKFIINGDNDIEDLLKDINYQIFNWLDERNKLFTIIKDTDIAVIDSYLADISLYNKIANLVKISVYIDDNKRLDYPNGIVVNGNIHAEKLKYPKKDGITYLLGNKYTPLRKEFWEVPEKKIKENIESIMVTFGGDDAKNMTPNILTFLKNKYPNLIKNVIIGRSFQNIDEIKKCADKNTNLSYYPDAEKMKEVMLNSDVAISAGGQTLYELARVGVPTIGICFAKNQKLNLRGWQEAGFIDFIGWSDKKELIRGIENSLEKLVSYKRRIEKKQIGRETIDGYGVKRVVKFLENYRKDK